MAKKILIVVGGGTKHVAPFVEAGKRLGIDVDLASFSKLEYESSQGEVVVKMNGVDLAFYDTVYLRLVGKRYEDAALLVYYCRKRGVRIVDRTYELDAVIRVPLPKSIEAKMLIDAGVSFPKTYFGRLKMIAEVAPRVFGYPFVVKGTAGKQGHAVWSPKDSKEMEDLIEKFGDKEKKGELRFLAQEFIEASQRNRIFVIGEKAIAGITRPTRWRKRYAPKGSRFYEGVREALNPIPREDAELAVRAAKALGVEVGGADVITEDATGKKYILEVNSAPRWSSLKKDTGIDVEEEILKYLADRE